MSPIPFIVVIALLIIVAILDAIDQSLYNIKKQTNEKKINNIPQDVQIVILCGNCKNPLGETYPMTEQEFKNKKAIIQLRNALYPLTCKKCGNTGWNEHRYYIQICKHERKK